MSVSVNRLREKWSAKRSNARLTDVITNQVAISYQLGHDYLTGTLEPSADEPFSSRACRQADCGTEYREWLQRIGQPDVLSRKTWEHVAILRALRKADVLRPGSRGLGFGVGREALVAEFASRGVDVVATDLSVDDRRSAAWVASGQHASLSLDQLTNDRICSREILESRVTLRAVDMNLIPSDLADFDFLWSACALEHLGSLEAGLTFVERSLSCLKPNGIAVHTTEFNLDSDGDTVAQGETVLYRKADMVGFRDRLLAKGHEMSPFEIGPRAGLFDIMTDFEPYHESALVIRFKGYRVTSAVIVARRGPA